MDLNVLGVLLRIIIVNIWELEKPVGSMMKSQSEYGELGDVRDGPYRLRCLHNIYRHHYLHVCV